jgi:hypothetical protein
MTHHSTRPAAVPAPCFIEGKKSLLARFRRPKKPVNLSICNGPGVCAARFKISQNRGKPAKKLAILALKPTTTTPKCRRLAHPVLLPGPSVGEVLD